MKGADIVTAQFRNHTTCTLVDRHVPHVPYPFADSPNSIYPFPDQCQTDGSWLLINCETDPHNGHMLLEVSRTLSAHDTQDRRIASGPQAIIHAYGAGFGYHSARRGSTRVELFREDGTVVPVHNQNPVPSDVNHEQQLLAEYQVPPRETSYICTSFKLQTGPRKGRMIVAAEPVLRSNTRSLAHHMILYICMKSAFTEYFAGGNECYGGEAEPPGGFPAWACRGLAVTCMFHIALFFLYGLSPCRFFSISTSNLCFFFLLLLLG